MHQHGRYFLRLGIPGRGICLQLLSPRRQWLVWWAPNGHRRWCSDDTSSTGWGRVELSISYSAEVLFQKTFAKETVRIYKMLFWAQNLKCRICCFLASSNIEMKSECFLPFDTPASQINGTRTSPFLLGRSTSARLAWVRVPLIFNVFVES